MLQGSSKPIKCIKAPEIKTLGRLGAQWAHTTRTPKKSLARGSQTNGFIIIKRPPEGEESHVKVCGSPPLAALVWRRVLLARCCCAVIVALRCRFLLAHRRRRRPSSGQTRGNDKADSLTLVYLMAGRTRQATIRQ